MNDFIERWKLIMVYICATIFLLSGFVVAEPLHDAAKEGDLEKAKSLIAEGSDVNAVDNMGATPLYFAQNGGQKDMVELLIKHGAHE